MKKQIKSAAKKVRNANVSSVRKRIATNQQPKSQTTKQAVASLETATERLAKQNKGSDADYAQLQYTWNRDILERAHPYFPRVSKTAIGIGSFMGALEIAISPEFKTVTCVDHKSYLPLWRPKNLVFHRADIDTADWKLPTPDERFDVCFFIETIEHLLWSPLPLLQWMKQNCHLIVISTPDDAEWPAMEIHPWTRYGHFSTIPAASPGVEGNPLPMYHTKQYSQAEFIELLDTVGFRVLEFFRTGDGKHQMCAIAQPR